MDTLTKWISRPVGCRCIPSPCADTDIPHVLASHRHRCWARTGFCRLPRVGHLVGTTIVRVTHTTYILSLRCRCSPTLYGSDLLSPMLFSMVSLPPSLLYNLWVLFLLVTGALGMRRLLLFLQCTHHGPHWQVDGHGCVPHFYNMNYNQRNIGSLLSTGLLTWFIWLTLSI